MSKKTLQEELDEVQERMQDQDPDFEYIETE